MNKKTIGYIVSALLVGTLIFIMVKNNMDDPEPVDTSVTTQAANEGKLQQNSEAPNFTLQTRDGETVTLHDLRGKKVVLNFWATWCPPCKAEMPHMQKYYSKSAEADNVEIVAVNVTSSEKLGIKAVEDFIESYGLTFKIPLDEDGSVAKQYEAYTMPTTYMIDTNGKIAQKIVGPLDEKMLVDLIGSMD